jgi:hypothetical protein
MIFYSMKLADLTPRIETGRAKPTRRALVHAVAMFSFLTDPHCKRIPLARHFDDSSPRVLAAPCCVSCQPPESLPSQPGTDLAPMISDILSIVQAYAGREDIFAVLGAITASTATRYKELRKALEPKGLWSCQSKHKYLKRSLSTHWWAGLLGLLLTYPDILDVSDLKRGRVRLTPAAEEFLRTQKAPEGWLPCKWTLIMLMTPHRAASTKASDQKPSVLEAAVVTAVRAWREKAASDLPFVEGPMIVSEYMCIDGLRREVGPTRVPA